MIRSFLFLILFGFFSSTAHAQLWKTDSQYFGHAPGLAPCSQSSWIMTRPPAGGGYVDATGQVINYDPGDYVYAAPGLTNKIITCITDSVMMAVFGEYNTVTQRFDNNLNRPNMFMQMETLLQGITTTILTIYLILFGYKVVLGGVRNAKSEVLTTLSLMLFILFMVQYGGLREYTQGFLTIQQAMVNVVAGTLDDMRFSKTSGRALDVCAYEAAWLRIDCLIAKIMGADPENYVDASNSYYPMGNPNNYPWGGMGIGPFLEKNPNTPFIARDGSPITGEFLAFITLAASMLFTSLGPFIFILGGFIPILMAAAFAQAMLVFVSSFIIIIFLGLIGYIIIPLMLFKQTQQMFDYWFQLVVAYTLQPAILMGYLVFMVYVINVAMHSELSPFQNTHSTQLSENFETLRTKIKDEDNRCMRQVFNFSKNNRVDAQKNDTGGTQASSGLAQGSFAVPSFVIPGPDGKCDPSSPDNAQFQADTFQNMLKLGILMFLTFGFMSNVMNFGAQLSGVIASPVSNAINVYNMATSKLNKAISK